MDGGFVPYSAADWQAAVPGLKRKGREYVGACPMPDCGGEDRFHVNDEGVIGCRGCIDGRPEAERKRRFGEIVRHVFGEPERRQMNGAASPTRTFTYCRPDGTPYHRSYRQGDGEGKRCWQDKGHKGKFYPYLIEHAPDWGDLPIVIPEGEPCAERLAGLGYAAVTWCGGTGAVTRTRWGALAGREIILWPDNDATGDKAMRQLAEILDGLGCAARWVSVPEGKPSGWDCRDAPEADVHRLIDQAGPNSSLAPIGEGEGETLSLMPMAEFLTAPIPPISWVVDGLINGAGLSILPAKPKAGKSTTARFLGLAVARGETFLGRSTRQGAVLYLAFEEDPSHVKAHFETMGARLDDPIFLHIGPPGPDLGEAVDRAIAQHKPALVILDPLGDTVKVREDTYMDWKQAMNSIAWLARQHRVAILVCHHNRKADAADYGDEILGSTAIRGAVDTTLHLRRDGEQRVIRSEQRYGDDMPPTVLHLDPVTQRIEAGQSVADIAARQMEDEIMQAIVDKGKPMNKSEIERAVKGNNGHKRRATDRLLADGRLHSWKQGNATVHWIERAFSPSPSPIEGETNS